MLASNDYSTYLRRCAQLNPFYPECHSREKGYQALPVFFLGGPGDEVNTSGAIRTYGGSAHCSALIGVVYTIVVGILMCASDYY